MFPEQSRREFGAPSRLSDEQLLERIADGDRDALTEMYQVWHRRLMRFLSRHTRHRDLIDEVINDTFMVVWQKAGDFRGESRASTWVMGIAYRCMLGNLRQHGNTQAGAEAEPDEFGSSASPAEAHELHDWLDKGLSRLSCEQRDALELAYCMGHSLEEIAALTGCPVSTVKARMFHARVKLGILLRWLDGRPGAP